MVLSPTLSKHLGVESVNGLSRLEIPAARITACIIKRKITDNNDKISGKTQEGVDNQNKMLYIYIVYLHIFNLKCHADK
jgi:hypothetical protein